MWSDKDDTAIKLIVRLIELTNGKKIMWQRELPYDQEMPHDRHYLNYFYLARVGNDIFRLSEFQFKKVLSGERHFWERGVNLDIVDPEGRVVWHCPPNPAVHDLFEIVVESAADIDGVIARLDSFAQAS